MALVSERSRRLARRLVWLLGTAVVYAVLDRFAVRFQVEPGVSMLFPGTAAAIVACLHGGLWGAAGVFIGSLAGPLLSGTWATEHIWFAGINALEGLIPWVLFRIVPGVSTDLRDLRSLMLFIVSGTVLNTGLSATLGTALIGNPDTATIVGHELVVWWIADFSAAVLIAMPVLAFGDRLLRMVSPAGEDEPAAPLHISATLQVTAVIVILGWSASAIARNTVSARVENDRLARQERSFEARSAVSNLHSNFLRAAALESSVSAPSIEQFEETRAFHFGLIGDVDALVSTSTPAAIDQFNRLRAKTATWFSRARRELAARPADPSTAAEAHQLSREFLNLQSSIENADAQAWARFRETRARLTSFQDFVDLLVLAIIVVAFGTLLTRISRPLGQLSASISMLGTGSLPASRRGGDLPFMELQALDDALYDAARELHEREGELQKQTAEAVEASRHKSAFLAKMSHELRTPLNAIIGFSELLRDAQSVENEREKHFAENIAHSARLLLSMIDDLLEIAKLESGEISIRRGNCDLGDIVRSAVSAVAALVAERQQRLDVRIPGKPLPAVLDAEKLIQVLMRLLMNASKFSPQGSPIVIRAEITDRNYEIGVEDRGVGIGPQDHERIFETFEQVYDRGVYSQGAGLGLTVARRFTEAQGGTILVRSNSGRGATFTVRIPMEANPNA